jgi:hypothetical protein
MSNSAMLGMDARLRSAFKATGWADNAVFRSSGVNVPNCTVLIDRGVQLIGDQSQVSNNHITLTCYLAQTGKLPQRSDTFTIGSDVFCIDSPPIEQDESASVFIVTEKGL